MGVIDVHACSVLADPPFPCRHVVLANRLLASEGQDGSYGKAKHIDDVAGDPLRVHIEGRPKRPVRAGCGVFAHVKDRPVVELVDLPCFGRGMADDR